MVSTDLMLPSLHSKNYFLKYNEPYFHVGYAIKIELIPTHCILNFVYATIRITMNLGGIAQMKVGLRKY